MHDYDQDEIERLRRIINGEPDPPEYYVKEFSDVKDVIKETKKYLEEVLQKD